MQWSQYIEHKKKLIAENIIKEVRRTTRRTFSSEQKITIVIEALRSEQSVTAYNRSNTNHISIAEPLAPGDKPQPVNRTSDSNAWLKHRRNIPNDAAHLYNQNESSNFQIPFEDSPDLYRVFY